MAYKKMTTLKDELNKTMEQIEKTENTLVALKNHKKELEVGIEEAELRDLRNALKKNGKSISEVIDFLSA